MVKLSLFLSLLATVGNFTSTTVTTQPPARYGDVIVTKEELRFVDLANQERASRGLPELVLDPMLVKIARKHSQEMSD
ncbi:MAG: CAP domain-containing protein, partial [Armatimonadota bacterium]